MDCFDNNLGNNFENNAWNLGDMYNAEKLQKILNRIMQGIMSIIASALPQMLYVQLFMAHLYSDAVLCLLYQNIPMQY